MKVINGKVYTMWQQFLDKEDEWIGGKMINVDMGQSCETEITGVILKENGTESAMFGFSGKDFDFCADVRYIGISGEKSEGLMLHAAYVGTCEVFKKKDL